MLNNIIKQFSSLRTDHNRNRWTPLTCHRAPHKPFLLLSIMDLVAQGAIVTNFIEPSFELVETWNGYWHAVMPLGKTSSMAYPFYHMRMEPFWTLQPNPGHEDLPGRTISSMRRAREIYAGARMDEDLFARILDPVARELLRMTLVERYFAPEIQPQVADQGFVNFASFMYVQEILSGTAETPANFGEPEPTGQRVRDQGFRKAIVQLYDHRCALCGIRMLTPEGHTVVEAAHIVPWSQSRDDRPTNGLCLCRLCHWSFDEGLMGVGRKYEVLVSERARSDKNLPGHILSLSDREILKPDPKIHWPSQENLSRHRKTTFSG